MAPALPIDARILGILGNLIPASVFAFRASETSMKFDIEPGSIFATLEAKTSTGIKFHQNFLPPHSPFWLPHGMSRKTAWQVTLGLRRYRKSLVYCSPNARTCLMQNTQPNPINKPAPKQAPTEHISRHMHEGVSPHQPRFEARTADSPRSGRHYSTIGNSPHMSDAPYPAKPRHP